MSDLLDRRRAEAVDLIRALSMVAGDEQQVTALLAAYGRETSIARATDVCLAALVITYGSCMSQPVPLDIPIREGATP